MGVADVRIKALTLKAARTSAAFKEVELRMEMNQMCGVSRGAASDMAAQLDLSTQYLSDIRHGRRKFSDEVVDRLGRLK